MVFEEKKLNWAPRSGRWESNENSHNWSIPLWPYPPFSSFFPCSLTGVSPTSLLLIFNQCFSLRSYFGGSYRHFCTLYSTSSSRDGLASIPSLCCTKTDATSNFFHPSLWCSRFFAEKGLEILRGRRKKWWKLVRSVINKGKRGEEAQKITWTQKELSGGGSENLK